MKVLLFHPTLLPPPDYGGIERVVLWLAKGLRNLGHEVWVGAYRGSLLPEGVRLLEVSETDPSTAGLLNQLPSGMDVVHLMAPADSDVIDRFPCPVLLTVHGNGKPGERYPKNTVFLSADHARRHGAREFVFNGVDPDEYDFNGSDERRSFLFLSKTSWKVKNVRGAIDLCRKAGVPLTIAGGNRPILPRLATRFRRGMRWVGPVGGKFKAELLAHARALVFPVTWPEPFGLVVVEALISGAPVLASPIGSLPELVSSDVGALPRSEQEWLDWLSRERLPWSAESCRERAMRLFHFEVMARDYERVYRRLMAGEMLHERHPETQREQEAPR